MEAATSPDSEVTFNAPPEGGQGDTSFEEEVMDEIYEEAVSPEEPVMNDFRSRPGIQNTRRLRTYAVPRQNYSPLAIRPEVYDGVADWDEYFSHFCNCAELGGWLNNQRLLVLSASLRGSARTFYMGLAPIDRSSYHGLVQKLSHRFGRQRQQNLWVSRLEGRQRELKESIASYADDLRRMGKRAYPELDERAQEAITLNQLYKSISPELKYNCIDKGCKTVFEAVEVIERYEAIVGDSKDKRKLAVRATMGAEAFGVHRQQQQAELSQQQTLQKILAHIEGLEKKRMWTRGNRPERPHDKRTCYVCGAENHFMKNCPVLRKCKEQMALESKDKQPQSKSSADQGNFSLSA